MPTHDCDGGQTSNTINQPYSLSKARSRQLSQLKNLTTKTVGFVARSAMRTGAIVFTRRAKLEAFSAALGWFVKRNGYKPIRLTHASGYGDFDLMSDGKKIQLSWWLGGMPRPDDEGHTLDDDDPCSDTHAPAYCKQCNRQLAGNATDAHAYESGPHATLNCTRNPETQPQRAEMSVNASRLYETTITGGTQTIDEDNRKALATPVASGSRTMTDQDLDKVRDRPISQISSHDINHETNNGYTPNATLNTTTGLCNGMHSEEAASKHEPSRSSIGKVIGDEGIGDTVGSFFGDIVKSVVDDVSEQVFGQAGDACGDSHRECDQPSDKHERTNASLRAHGNRPKRRQSKDPQNGPRTGPRTGQ